MWISVSASQGLLLDSGPPSDFHTRVASMSVCVWMQEVSIWLCFHKLKSPWGPQLYNRQIERGTPAHRNYTQTHWAPLTGTWNKISWFKWTTASYLMSSFDSCRLMFALADFVLPKHRDWPVFSSIFLFIEILFCHNEGKHDFIVMLV